MKKIMAVDVAKINAVFLLTSKFWSKQEFVWGVVAII